ncbi:hypothetical protein A2852_02045 [Candidatus Adlerbacteria bacterium RIFCSPHIGHO2_01_FULL_54_23]|uniref:DUF4145 domain-containing protein n=4 Tax=Candidatus Adleribacteriota TaxID=1752736 RepID=A0A0G1ZIB8_9BACT|nr:MAG: hypothetical protein UY61_C0066G0007 [Candidatus Adlerbacteria bacterium GW2011_GWC1_50_9]KKW35651.1 MAG: hypothetical protein UY83_C0005G0032 [Candidatus Adlerbacteria bacterium GW2011_GWA1_54_10]KKW36144.1 MAG: hypothetical protein UY84_C0001G0032 [Candidatus Adlerbacteria bacterium GW2011_GWA2_54_12]KKW37402.1 MAG: hypothetical protein UY86_C0009G0036 [Candidatus Adlerbacteria bacterium GW2011_GWB1_54_7]OGC79111.1 MAG: hypothetical protein A2852_02045 [Candidatus Adlerbacteria bacter
MAKNLSHQDWVKQQFGKYLKSSYRNVFVHSSIIEGILANESGMDKFDSANKFLLCSQKINSSEFCVFNNIRKIRNKLAHDIFKRKGLSQNEIDKLRDDLMKEIHNAYIVSNFLNNKLFEKYKLKRSSVIGFEPAN